MQKQRLIFLVIAVALGVLAVVIAQKSISDKVQGERAKLEDEFAKQKEEQAAVIVAREDLEPGTVIQPGMLEIANIKKEFVQPRAAGASDQIIGAVVNSPIFKGEQVDLTKLAPAAQASQKQNLSAITPAGKRAVIVAVDNIRDLIELLKPGDSVNVTAIVSVPSADEKGKTQETILPVFQGVRVLAVGKQVGQQTISKDKEIPTTITLALAPKEESLLLFLQEQGKVRVSIRSQNDSSVENVQPVTWDNIFQYLPALNPGGQRDGSGEQNGETIEVYHGLKKENMTLSH